MQCPDTYLNLGAVVRIQGNDKTVMVIARAILLDEQGARRYYDYAGCLYPEGITGDAAIYFNHDVVTEVLAEGYSDEADQVFVPKLREVVERLDVERGNPGPVSTW